MRSVLECIASSAPPLVLGSMLCTALAMPDQGVSLLPFDQVPGSRLLPDMGQRCSHMSPFMLYSSLLYISLHCTPGV